MAKRPERVHVTLFIPGRQPDLKAWRKALNSVELTLDRGRLGGERLPFTVGVEWVENPNDGSFGQAFSFGTASASEQRRIDATPGALLLSLPVDLHRERAAITALARALASSGALAIRIEESKLGFPIERWLELVDGEDPWSLYRAAVVVLGGKEEATTCGMQVFSLPDAHVALDKKTSTAQANELLGVLNVYQLAEDPLLLPGHTFSPDAETPRRELRRWPDATYPPSHACHNPFGVWRLGSPGKKPSPPSELAFVFMPALAALLTAAEAKSGKPLTKQELEALTSGAIGINMSHEDARQLELSRGYADLDPELVWEQWQARAR